MFAYNSFYSTTDMYDTVYDYAYSLIGKHGIVGVRKQKRSVGIICRVNKKELKIDLVPCKATKGLRNQGYLCVNKETWWSQDSTYTKTNFHLLNKQRLTHTQKNLVVLLKEWKRINKVPLPSYLLENLVLDAYRYNQGMIPRSLTDKLIMVFNFIAKNLNTACIRSIENTNNILTEIPDGDKADIIYACKSVVNKFNYQPNSIIKNFTTNNA
ncbi:hypothetical protein A4R26_24100 [Niastella populi]|uniref:Uncharacterized protein n=2 Tax=Niastella populi TaxID=550983 RepID=A0A1V9FGW7_9BACT|nr:hypothetical protein A4R26_24100 [Niastella populi]